MFLDTPWSSTITPKGFLELLIQWVVPAVTFDWLTYIPGVMFIPSALCPLHSPSKKVGYLGAGWAIFREQRARVYIHSQYNQRKSLTDLVTQQA